MILIPLRDVRHKGLPGHVKLHKDSANSSFGEATLPTPGETTMPGPYWAAGYNQPLRVRPSSVLKVTSRRDMLLAYDCDVYEFDCGYVDMRTLSLHTLYCRLKKALYFIS